MKAFVVIALLAFVAASQALNEQEKAAIGKYYKECVDATKVDEALIKRLRAGEEVEDENLVKYVGCMFGKLNFVSADGHLQEDVIRAKLPSDFDKDEAAKIISECKEVTGNGADGISFAAYRCFLKKSSKIIEF